jgi:hypothetical protein
MYESSCSYQSALDLKRAENDFSVLKRAPSSPSSSIIKSEEFSFPQNAEWTSYRFHQSTFEQLKQSVEKAKAALQDRTFLGSTSAFSDLYTVPRLNDSQENISSSTLSNHIHHNNNNNNITINSSNLNLSPLANVTNNSSSQTSTSNHNHSHSNGLTNQRLNSASHVTSQSHETNHESTKARQQSKFDH